MARLDRLGPAREVAQIGSVIGRDFSYALLRAVAGMDDVPLQAALDRLADADLILVQGLPPDAEYRFKHALFQDAACENLLKSRRLCCAIVRLRSSCRNGFRTYKRKPATITLSPRQYDHLQFLEHLFGHACQSVPIHIRHVDIGDQYLNARVGR